MRRFGSIGVLFCKKCLLDVSRRTRTCKKCNSKKNVVGASLDVTAYKNGLYLMITAKWRRRGSVYVDDSDWKNMVSYTNKFNAIPVFAGVHTTGKMYFTDLRTLMPLDVFYKKTIGTKVDKNQMQEAIKEAWKIIALCNRILGEGVTVCPNCETEIKIQGADMETIIKSGVKWVKEKTAAVNVLQRCLWRAGETRASTDITQLFNKEGFKQPTKEEIEKEKEEERKAVEQGALRNYVPCVVWKCKNKECKEINVSISIGGRKCKKCGADQ